MPRDDQALSDMIEQSAAILTAAGMPRMPSRVLMALTVADGGGMTAVELAERLGVSAAAISGAVRYLQGIGIVRRLARAGSRRDSYETPENMWSSTIAQEQPVYRALAAQGEAALVAIDEPESEASRRLEEMVGFYRFLDRRMPELMAEWEAQR
ncbi:GbsR/MarR family transcriptional regulator [Leifsonia sp. Root112D2]|uniref:GbsR/MarR family transcriptional regulator n=1 Tax=Leifsonia sp. Root112D2 TaxID=1736426 RepID=UPI0006F4D4AE|nr:MarR family transcriptional regulator [Leifsonia sp. Root112D2]KQV06624.1 hypothetical protein ASC63_04195 [Leifsonia sp. Root112D2]